MDKYKADFWAQVDTADRSVTECWNWNGRLDANGYGLYKGQRAHRVSLALSGLLLDNRQDVDHRCHNKRCVSPWCLQIMTHSDHARKTASER